MHVAALASQSETLRMLVSAGCEVNLSAVCLKGGTPAHSAAQYGASDGLKTLIELKADMSKTDNANLNRRLSYCRKLPVVL